jgi:amidase
VSIADLAAGVRSGRLRARDVLEEHAARALAAAELNVFAATTWEQARRRADEIDQLDPAERAGLPLAGVPMTVKDLICVAGVATDAGSAGWAGRVALADASAVASARAAGALLLGKTNLPEFAMGTTTENPTFGRTLNPLAPGRTPGGSSGGESAAIAAGISAAGLGTDYGGSLRWPAHCTGIAALRPTPGRIPGTGQVPGAGGTVGDTGPPLLAPTTQQGLLQVIGPLAPGVEDLRLLLTLLARPDGIDLRVPLLPVPEPAGIGSLQIGWSTGAAIAPVRAEVAALVEAIAHWLTPVCAGVVETPAAFVGCREAYDEVRALEPHPDHLLALGDQQLRSVSGGPARLIPSPGPDPVALARAWGTALETRRKALQIFKECDVVLLPVAAGPAAELDGGLDVDGTRVAAYDLMAHCRAVTLLGTPVVSVPVGLSAEGLPLSVQVIAAPWHEHLALDVARRLEDFTAGNATAKARSATG